MTQSALEATMALQIEYSQVGLPEMEYRWHETRQWRFDFAWPDRLLALEVEGGVYSQGRHVRPVGFSADCEKYNEAAAAGWRVLRMPGEWVLNGRAIDMLERLWQKNSPDVGSGPNGDDIL